MSSQNKSDLVTLGSNHVVIAGSWELGILEDYSGYTMPIASGDDLVMVANIAGTAADSLLFTSDDDGGVLASCEIAFGTDTLVITAAASGEDKNGLKVFLVPGGTAASEVATEDGDGNLYVSYEVSTSTTTNVASAINGHANWICSTTGSQKATGLLSGELEGGTEDTWAEYSDPDITLHFSNGVSDLDAAVAAINAVSGIPVTASGTGSNVIVTGDKVTSQSFTGGVDAIDIAEIRGKGYTVAQTAAGTYLITLKDPYKQIQHVNATLQLETAGAYRAQLGTISESAGTIVVRVINNSGVAADPVSSPAACDRMNFRAAVVNSLQG